jgi:hypothetical protein
MYKGDSDDDDDDDGGDNVFTQFYFEPRFSVTVAASYLSRETRCLTHSGIV